MSERIPWPTIPWPPDPGRYGRDLEPGGINLDATLMKFSELPEGTIFYAQLFGGWDGLFVKLHEIPPAPGRCRLTAAFILSSNSPDTYNGACLCFYGDQDVVPVLP